MVLQSISEHPFVSVILTSYNYEKYVGEAIRSVLNQTYTNLELLIVDDGSTDGSKDVISAAVEEANIPVKTIFKSNGGQASALNAGYISSSGEVVCFIDSDDVWYEEKVEILIDFMRMFPGGGIYQHQMDTCNGPKQQVMVSGDLFGIWKSLGKVNKAVVPAVIDRPFIPTSGLASTREALDGIFPLPEDLVTCPDGYITRTACIQGPLLSLPATLGMWRDHGENAGKKPEYRRKYWLSVLMPTINRYYREHGLDVTWTYARHDTGRNEVESEKAGSARSS